MSSFPTIKIEDATLRQARARVALFGPSGCGKTLTMLIFLDRWAEILDTDYAVIDTEHGTASKYAGLDVPGRSGRKFKFKTITLQKPYSPAHYIAGLDALEKAGIKLCGLDSISHEWMGEGGAQQIADEAGARMGGNRWAGWSVATPEHNRFLERILGSDMHIIATMRAKTEWLQEGGKPKKVGLGPVQRENVEYEFDIVLQQAIDHSVEILKSRAITIPVGQVIEAPDGTMAEAILNWLQQGEAPAAAPKIEEAKAEGEESAEEAPKVKPATVKKIEKLMGELQEKHADYSGLTDESGTTQTWEERMKVRMVQWYTTDDASALSEDQGKDLVGKLQDTIVQLDRKKEEAASLA